jgi:hypothetical protein
MDQNWLTPRPRSFVAMAHPASYAVLQAVIPSWCEFIFQPGCRAESDCLSRRSIQLQDLVQRRNARPRKRAVGAGR